jgi:outer membrane protein TolC
LNRTKLLPVLLLLLFSRLCSAIDITLEDVVERVSKENYFVLENALKVYEAKEAIQVAKMNLYPHLNVWRMLGAAGEFATLNFGGLGGLINDIAPFLVPANWFRVKQVRLLYFAEKEGYRALWANELMTAKALYHHMLLDRSILSHTLKSKLELGELLTIVSSREQFGGAPLGSSRDLEVQMLLLDEDIRQLKVLVAEERGRLAHMMGVASNETVEPVEVMLPDFENLRPLTYEDFEFRAIDSSPEVRQYDHFLEAVNLVKQEVFYSFLGTSSLTRGVDSGVFDWVPIQDGLGFGATASMRIVSAKKEILRTQSKAAESTIKRQLQFLVEQYNLDLESYRNLKRHVQLTQEINDQLRDRMRLGQDISTLNLIQASRNAILAQTAWLAVKYRFIANADRLARLIFHGEYNMKPVMIETLSPHD